MCVELQWCLPYDGLMMQRKLNTTSVYRRLLQVSLAVALLVVVLSMWVSSNTIGLQIQQDNTTQLSRAFAKQSALAALRFVQQQNIDGLTVMLNDLSQDDYITQAMVYDKTGKIIARSKDAVSAHQAHIDKIEPFDAIIPVNQPLPAKPQSTYIVSEIIDGDSRLGYLRINYLQHQALAIPLKHHQNNMRQMLLMVMIAMLIGYMLTRGFSRFSRNSVRVN